MVRTGAPRSGQASQACPDGRIRAMAGDRQSAGPRRRLQIALATMWLLDAALQYQPYMFTRAFPAKIISASAAGGPGLVAGPVVVASHLLASHPAAWNAVLATGQLTLATALLLRPAVRLGLAASIIWSLSVWWLGESLGGLLSGTASPLSGAPGAVILYALVALLAWPARGDDRPRSCVADGSLLGPRWSRLLWLVLWGSYAYLILQAPVRAPRAVRASLAGLAAGEPRWIAAIDQAAAAAAGRGLPIAILLAAAFAVIGVAIFVPAATRTALSLSMIVAMVIWVIGENFGLIATGHATDPNTGPLLILVSCAFWPVAAPDAKRALIGRAWHRCLQRCLRAPISARCRPSAPLARGLPGARDRDRCLPGRLGGGGAR